MTQEQIVLVKTSFKAIEVNYSKVIKSFYSHLFELHPEIRRLFKQDMSAQSQKLMDMIKIAVSNIDDLSLVMSNLKELGKRHVDYGVQPKHYNIVGESLLWAFEDELKENFTFATKEAWGQLYSLISSAMLAY